MTDEEVGPSHGALIGRLGRLTGCLLSRGLMTRSDSAPSLSRTTHRTQLRFVQSYNCLLKIIIKNSKLLRIAGRFPNIIKIDYLEGLIFLYLIYKLIIYKLL